jgi:GT2 family glycosyltransferase
MNKSIAFIIIAYHPKMREFRKLLRTLEGYPIIIVDNGGTLSLDDVGRATLLSQIKNVGYGAAANIGIHNASGFGAKWFVILNQDMKLTRAAVLSLIRQLKKLPPCVAGTFAAGLDESRWTTILPSKKLDYLTGSCVAIHERIIGKVGYFYEPYFLYYEDVDYCIRTKNAGYPLTRIDLVDVAHEESASLGRGSQLHQYYLARNHMLFVQRLAPTPVKLYEFFRLGKTLYEHVAREERGALLGLRDYMFRRFGMIKEGKI